MKRATLHRLISEKLEPKPTYRKRIHLTDTVDGSDGGFWERSTVKQRQASRPLDYSRSEDASAKLRDAMLNAMSPREWFDRIISAMVALQCQIPFRNGSGLAERNALTLTGENWRSCQALAAAKWLGIQIQYGELVGA